jgi:hypothetical protein
MFDQMTHETESMDCEKVLEVAVDQVFGLWRSDSPASSFKSVQSQVTPSFSFRLECVVNMFTRSMCETYPSNEHTMSKTTTNAKNV